MKTSQLLFKRYLFLNKILRIAFFDAYLFLGDVSK